jgi:DNA-binding IclR family transcriptional regulator
MEHKEGMRYVGPHARNGRGEIFLSHRVSGPSPHITPERIPQCGKMAVFTANEISRKRGIVRGMHIQYAVIGGGPTTQL